MQKKNKILVAASLLAIVAVGGVAVGTTTALFSREAKAQFHINAGTLKVGFYVESIELDQLKSDGSVEYKMYSTETELKALYGSGATYVANRGIDLGAYSGDALTVNNAFPSMKARINYLVVNYSAIKVDLTHEFTDETKAVLSDEDHTEVGITNEAFTSAFNLSCDLAEDTTLSGSKELKSETDTLKPGCSVEFSVDVKFKDEVSEKKYELCSLYIDSLITATQIAADDWAD